MHIYLHLVIFHDRELAETETPPTSGANVRLFRRVGGNVCLKDSSDLEFFTAKSAWKSRRILGMISFNVVRHTMPVQVGFPTSRKSTWQTGSFGRAMNDINVSP